MRGEIRDTFFEYPDDCSDWRPPYWALGGSDVCKFKTPSYLLALLREDGNDWSRLQRLQEAVAIICQARIAPAPTPDEAARIRSGLLNAAAPAVNRSSARMGPRILDWAAAVANLCDPAIMDEHKPGCPEKWPERWVERGRMLHSLLEMFDARFSELELLAEVERAGTGHDLRGVGRAGLSRGDGSVTTPTENWRRHAH
ncbi:hypothetical protein M2322_002769 [Rhodoblastus acidophilus]|uniref:hypothetical protein n=1 Tax=Rhodoblastus acidophilus TaxID=1074 RepID=UPI002225648E|nr:hypothetical protein [Rhodoblastus acidophilus]MCW2317215.1 hypothetical protein [Rhodoblastus acidophilus]